MQRVFQIIRWFVRVTSMGLSLSDFLRQQGQKKVQRKVPMATTAIMPSRIPQACPVVRSGGQSHQS